MGLFGQLHLKQPKFPHEKHLICDISHSLWDIFYCVFVFKLPNPMDTGLVLLDAGGLCVSLLCGWLPSAVHDGTGAVWVLGACPELFLPSQ